ncbi:MAG: DUF2782 domain-containing protein [Dokdonella sp.]
MATRPFPIRPFLLAASLTLACSAFAADPPKKYPQAPPPPGINDPGVAAGDVNAPSADAAPSATGSTAAATEPESAAASTPVEPLAKPDTRPVRDKASRDAEAGKKDTTARAAASDVTIRQQGDDTVEEYRQGGRLWMVRIVKPNGPTQTFLDASGNGRLQRDPNEGPVDPVYFTIYQWN